MKTLKVWAIVIVMLAVSVPSFGYILIYKTYERTKAIDSEASILVGKAVRGYLIMDINDNDGDINDSYWLTYGKDEEDAKVYTLSVPDLQREISGKYQTLYLNIDEGWYVSALGKMSSKNIGLAARQTIAYTLSGNFIILDSSIFDLTQLLRGGGTVVITLNSIMTQAINATSDPNLDGALTNVTTLLETDGYSL
jgi:hypothetical protein